MKSTSPKDKDSQQNDELRNAGIAGLSAETVNRYGSASANKDKAYSNMAEARKYQEEMKTAMVACKGIRRRAAMFDRLLLRLGTLFDPLVYDLEHIIATSGTDYNLYTLPQKQTVAAALSLAGAIKAVLDTPILTEDGQITPESEQVSGKVTALIEKNHV